jgi:hypothetical protein
MQFKYYEGGEKVKSVKLQSLRRQYELPQMDKNQSIGSYMPQRFKAWFIQ